MERRSARCQLALKEMNLLIGKAVRTLEKASSYADVKEDQIKAIQREHYWN